MIVFWVQDGIIIGILGDQVVLEINMLMFMLKCFEGMGLIECCCDMVDEWCVLIYLIQIGCVMQDWVIDILFCVNKVMGFFVKELVWLIYQMYCLCCNLIDYVECNEQCLGQVWLVKVCDG